MCKGDVRTHARTPCSQPTARSARTTTCRNGSCRYVGTLLLADLCLIAVMMCSSGINGFAAADAVAQIRPSTNLLHSQRWVLKTAHQNNVMRDIVMLCVLRAGGLECSLSLHA